MWEPARCPEMMEFGNGSDVLQIRAQKYVGGVVGRSPRLSNPAVVSKGRVCLSRNMIGTQF